MCVVPACPEPGAEELAAAALALQSTANDASLPVIGALEWASIEPSGLVMEARIDTGAETSSIHAEDILPVEKDGVKYVRFKLQHPETDEEIELERRVKRRVLIKQSVDGPSDRRYVVALQVTLGEVKNWLELSLTDRGNFDYPLLLGRNLLVDEFVVDVSKRHTIPKQRYLEK